LRGLAYGLNPVVLVGKNGVTDEFMVFVNRTLDDHELIKVKFIDHKDDKKELSKQINVDSQSIMVGMTGNTAIFYREHPKPEKRKITIP
jgi:RNA-binding protein